MKSIKNILFLILIFCNNNFTQNDEIIGMLYSEDIQTVIGATYIIMDYSIDEALPHIVRIYESKPAIVKNIFLLALQQFKYEDISLLCHDFIEHSDEYSSEEPPLNPAEARLNATVILFSISDYSTYNYVFEMVYLSGIQNINFTCLTGLDLIIGNVPQGSLEAKDILTQVWDHNLDPDIKIYAMNSLLARYGQEFRDKSIVSFESENDFLNRSESFQNLCRMEPHSSINLSFKNHLIQESETSLRLDISDSLLSIYGKPADLKYCIDYQPTEPNETSRSLMNYSIKKFIPPRPTVTTEEMIENLIAYNDELLQYGWITEYPVYNSYKKILEKTQESYRSQSLPDLCENLNSLLQLAENQHGGTLLTEEGYKFLHYHGTYIKENVESEFGTCEEREK